FPDARKGIGVGALRPLRSHRVSSVGCVTLLKFLTVRHSKWLATRAFPQLMYNRTVRKERASYNGSIEASQASDVGSIPIARSINLVDSVALPLLRLKNGAN